MQASLSELIDKLGSVSLSDKEQGDRSRPLPVLGKKELDSIQRLSFKAQYNVAKYEGFYNASEGLKNFVRHGKIDLGEVQERKEEFFRCMAPLCLQANPLDEVMQLASKATAAKDGDGYDITVSEAALERMPLFHFVAKVPKELSCVPQNINWKLPLDDGTCISGYISECIPKESCPDATLFITSYARWEKEKNLIIRWKNLSAEMRVVFVVRSYEFEAYHEALHDSKCSIFCFPDDSQWGIGYARHIIVKIMKARGVKYGSIMCDDSICYHYELMENGNHFIYEPRKDESNEMNCSEFMMMLTTICELYRNKYFAERVACISPAVHNPSRPNLPANYDKVWIWKAPTACHVLNIQLIADKDINFRPELRLCMEDLMFGLDCKKKGIKCLTWRKFALYEASNTGGGCGENVKIGSPQSAKKRRSAPLT